jgi:hypothetical protein
LIRRSRPPRDGSPFLFPARRIRRFAFAPPCFVQSTRRSSTAR